MGLFHAVRCGWKQCVRCFRISGSKNRVLSRGLLRL